MVILHVKPKRIKTVWEFLGGSEKRKKFAFNCCSIEKIVGYIVEPMGGEPI